MPTPPRGLENRMVFAAPSSRKSRLGGRGRWTAKRSLLGRKDSKKGKFVSHSKERWKLETRFAMLTCTLLSLLSIEGVVLAAFAIHIEEAEKQAAKSWGL